MSPMREIPHEIEKLADASFFLSADWRDFLLDVDTVFMMTVFCHDLAAARFFFCDYLLSKPKVCELSSELLKARELFSSFREFASAIDAANVSYARALERQNALVIRVAHVEKELREARASLAVASNETQRHRETVRKVRSAYLGSVSESDMRLFEATHHRTRAAQDTNNLQNHEEAAGHGALRIAQAASGGPISACTAVTARKEWHSVASDEDLIMQASPYTTSHYGVYKSSLSGLNTYDTFSP